MMNVVMERAARASRDAFQMRQETDDDDGDDDDDIYMYLTVVH